jgi:hypothetical protein
MESATESVQSVRLECWACSRGRRVAIVVRRVKRRREVFLARKVHEWLSVTVEVLAILPSERCSDKQRLTHRRSCFESLSRHWTGSCAKTGVLTLGLSFSLGESVTLQQRRSEAKELSVHRHSRKFSHSLTSASNIRQYSRDVIPAFDSIVATICQTSRFCAHLADWIALGVASRRKPLLAQHYSSICTWTSKAGYVTCNEASTPHPQDTRLPRPISRFFIIFKEDKSLQTAFV